MQTLHDVVGELNKNSLKVSLWGFFAGIMGQAGMGGLLGFLASATVVLSFLLAIISVSLKAPELIRNIKAWLKKKKDERQGINKQSADPSSSNSGGSSISDR